MTNLCKSITIANRATKWTDNIPWKCPYSYIWNAHNFFIFKDIIKKQTAVMSVNTDLSVSTCTLSSALYSNYTIQSTVILRAILYIIFQEDIRGSVDDNEEERIK